MGEVHTPDLLPCPFCGGEATWANAARGWKVECAGRFGTCTINARTHYQRHKFMAVNAWNTRATPAREAAEDLVEALEAFDPRQIGHGPSLNHEALDAAWQKARAVLARAKGGDT